MTFYLAFCLFNAGLKTCGFRDDFLSGYTISGCFLHKKVKCPFWWAVWVVDGCKCGSDDTCSA